MSLPGFTFLSSWESREAAPGLPCPPLCEVRPCRMRMLVACPQPRGVCPQGMWDMPAACLPPRRAMQAAGAQAAAGAGLWLELPGIGTAECARKLLERGLAN